MRLSKEIRNGLLIFLGIASLFLLMKILGLEKLNYLRALNIIIVYLGIRQTLIMNIKESNYDFGANMLSIMVTGLIGVVLSILALYLYIYYNGGQPYLGSLSGGFIFGMNPSVAEYCFGLFFEGIASLVILTFLVMQFWKPDSSKK